MESANSEVTRIAAFSINSEDLFRKKEYFFLNGLQMVGKIEYLK